VFKVLKQMNYISGFTSIFSDTQDPRLHSFTVCLNKGQVETNYNLNIIDTPGLFEQKIDSDKVRNNDILKKTIFKCLEYEITRINAIFFVCSFDQGINVQDLMAMKEFLDLFSGAEESICLLITRAESYTEERKSMMIKEILQHEALKDIVELIKNKIFFTGSIKYTDYDAGALDAVQRDCKSVYYMRKTIYDYIFAKESFCQLNDLNFFKMKKLETKKLMENILEIQKQQKKGAISSEYEEKITNLEILKGFASESEEFQTYRSIRDTYEELTKTDPGVTK